MERKIAGAALLALAAAVVLTGCSKPVLDYQNVQIENGKIYRADTDSSEGDTNTPFSGTVTNFPDDQMVAGNQKGMEKFLYAVAVGAAISDPTDAGFVRNQGPATLAKMLLGTTLAMCDVPVRDGILDGHVDCKVPSSDTHSTQMNFDGGTLDGDIAYFDNRGSKWAEGSFKDGIPDGTEKVYSTQTGTLVLEAPWDSGGWNGELKEFDPKTGELTYKVNYVDGKREGVATSYSPDGKQVIETETFVHDMANGPIDKYDSITGAHISHGMEVNGQLQGEAQRWNAQGELIANYVFKDGSDVTPSPAVAPINCASADADKRTMVERMICSNEAILDDDKQMMKAYKAAAASLVDTKRLEDNQRSWLADTRNSCATVECLDKAYKDRLAQLSSVGQPDLFGINCSQVDRSSPDDVRLICSDPNLLRDDQQMIASYKAAYVAAPAANKPVIDDGIRNWVDSVRYHCRDAVCMDRIFKDLTAKLNAIARDPSSPISASALSSRPSENTLTAVAPSPERVQVASTAQNGESLAGTAPAKAPSAVESAIEKPVAPSPSNISLHTAQSVTTPIHASFDCAKASSAVEKMICSNQMLADEDVQLMRVYKAALSASPNRSELRLKQRTWVMERNACTTSACVSNTYQQRISELDAAR